MSDALRDEIAFADLVNAFGVTWTMEHEVERIDVTYFGSTSRTFLPGLITWKFSYDGPISGTVSAHSRETLMAAAVSELLTRMR